MATELTQLKCGDCEKLRTFHGIIVCMETGCYADPTQPACISILPKLSARERRECKDKPRTH